MAAAAPLAGGGPRGHPRPPAARRRRATLGRRRPRDVRPLPRRPARGRGRARRRAAAPSSTPPSAPSSTPAWPRISASGVPSGGRTGACAGCSPAPPSCWSSPSAPASSASSQRNRAEAQALRSDAERVGALAQTAQDLGQSMLYGVAAVELEDRVQTRGSLLATLQRNPGLLLTRRLSEVEVAARRDQPGRAAARVRGPGRRRALHRPADLEAFGTVAAPRPPRPRAGDAVRAGRANRCGRLRARRPHGRALRRRRRPAGPPRPILARAGPGARRPDAPARVRARRPSTSPSRWRIFDDTGACRSTPSDWRCSTAAAGARSGSARTPACARTSTRSTSASRRTAR